jgi:hypothetical protein
MVENGMEVGRWDEKWEERSWRVGRRKKGKSGVGMEVFHLGVGELLSLFGNSPTLVRISPDKKILFPSLFGLPPSLLFASPDQQ